MSRALQTLDGAYAVCRLGPADEVPEWCRSEGGSLLALTRSDEELSIVCAERLVPEGVERSGGWRALRVSGTLEHDLSGVLASIAGPLAEAAIPIFAISSFDTDYVLVPAARLEEAVSALVEAGHTLG